MPADGERSTELVKEELQVDADVSIPTDSEDGMPADESGAPISNEDEEHMKPVPSCSELCELAPPYHLLGTEIEGQNDDDGDEKNKTCCPDGVEKNKQGDESDVPGENKSNNTTFEQL